MKDLIGEAITTVQCLCSEFYLIAQSKSKVLRRFGEHLTQTIEDNCAVKQWLAFNTYKETEEISKAMGEEHAVPEVLALLGQSRIASNLNQLAHHANIGALEMGAAERERLEEAYTHVLAIRALLVTVLKASP